ncbi:MAG TPA: hypothetical protein VM241_05535 [Candidatus Thermoplasmatota archaeon]|nr:hypothetical protein [Candidatus Thermoplasmatota archaeon]
MARLPMLLVERSFGPVEGRFHAYGIPHCPPVGHHATGRWSVRLAPGNATPLAGMGETWNFTNVHWASVTGSAGGDLFWGPREVPLGATFGAERFGVLAFNRTGFLLDGQPLQDGVRRTLTYGAVDDDGQTRAVTETLALRLFPAAEVAIERPAGFNCL